MVQLDDDDIVDGADSHESLRCPICFGIFDDPVFAGGRPCQHTYCRECIGQELQRTGKCPLDHLAIRKDDLVVNRFVQDSIEDITVHCRYRSRGCCWTGRLALQSGHAESCLVLRAAELESQLRQRDAQIAEMESPLRRRDARNFLGIPLSRGEHGVHTNFWD